MRVGLRPGVVLLAAVVVGILGLTAAAANVGGADAPAATGHTFAALGDQPPQRATALPEAVSDTNAVIGVDERIQVTDTTVYPQRAIAYLELYKASVLAGNCTGTFVGPDTLITAAHCLYRAVDGWTGNIAVVPGKDGAFEPYGYEWAAEWWVPDEWIDTGLSVYDWGVIKLPTEALGSTVGWFTVANLKTDTLARPDFFPAIIGYPGDKPAGTMWAGAKDAFIAVNDFTLEYDIDTASGQSGSAIFSVNIDEWFLAYVVGIHTQGSPIVNTGQRIDAELLVDVLVACIVMDCSISYVEETQATQTPTPTTTPPPGPSATPTPTSDTVPTMTPTVAATPVPTATVRATSTPRPTIVRAPTWTPGPTWTPQPTWTPNVPPTATPTPTFTSTPTPSVLQGDTSCDGVVNPLDAALILQLSAGLIAVLPCPGGGDTNGDGSVNPLDAALVLQFSAGLIDSLSPSGPAPTPTNTPSQTPTDTPRSIATPPPLPTSTPVPAPTSTLVPTSTPVPAPTTTPFPTSTPVPPSNTPVPPTNTALPTQPPIPTSAPVVSGAVLTAADDAFLGVFTCNQYAADGIFNRYGSYGSRYSTTSIWNRYGTYGGRYGTYSPFNRFATPPILSDGPLAVYLTVSSTYSPSVTPLDLVLFCFEGNSSKLDYWLGLVVDSS